MFVDFKMQQLCALPSITRLYQAFPGFTSLNHTLPSLKKLYQAASEIGDREKGELDAVDQHVVRLQVTVAHAVANQVTDSWLK